ncbi:ABC transporter permease [Sinorhizobium fredii]|uniref:Oligopeptide transport system permease protein n=1 Tax=Sinorhizobium fredii (strain HH103) TaxID=1117943 RepID=G9AAC3_SINF1|nr:ABC transporter permease [Sinorhizobium fredii]CCE97027.1 Oligopeptide transport system permease protein [Sinorhizobium fredii HH103]
MANMNETQIKQLERPMLRFLVELLSSKLALLGTVLFFSIVILAILAPWISPQNPYDLGSLNLLDSRLPPNSESMDGVRYWLGTDGQGRDMTSAIFYGLRTSILVGVVASVVALVVGTTLGLIAGYFRGWVDGLIMRVVDLQLSVPSILIAIVLLAVLGRGVGNIILALVAVQWVYFARTVRSSCLVEREKEYVQAGRLMGYSTWRILFRHILPNSIAPVTVVMTVEFAHAIALEATLSFLGVGLPVTEPSLGFLISAGFNYLLNGEYWISIFPGIALLLTVFSLNLIADQLRDITDPRLK